MLAPSPLSPDALAQANINPTSFLATDYLNHFNEVVMLMEMVPDMPDMVLDVMEWQPRAYPEHFQLSVFADKALAIEAYHAAPEPTRTAFDAVIGDLDRQIEDIQILLSGVDTSGAMDPALADRLMMTIVNDLRPSIDRASSIINAVDDSHSSANNAADDETKMRAQDAIDAMFD
ncbi:MAG: hypothetical protein AB8B88_10635 [Devosiaceae bacterium]